jgi:hypothetical protein
MATIRPYIAIASASATTKKLLKNVSGFSAKALMAAVPEAAIAFAAPKPVSPTARPAAIAIAARSKEPLVLACAVCWASGTERAKTAETAKINISMNWKMNKNMAVLFFKLFPPFQPKSFKKCTGLLAFNAFFCH